MRLKQMVILSDMPANNPLRTHVRNQTITISQEQCQKMVGLSKNKQTSTKERTSEILKVQKMFPSILYVERTTLMKKTRVFATISATVMQWAHLHSNRVLLFAEYHLSVCQETSLHSKVKCSYTGKEKSQTLQPKFILQKTRMLAYLVPNYTLYRTLQIEIGCSKFVLFCNPPVHIPA